MVVTSRIPAAIETIGAAARVGWRRRLVLIPIALATLFAGQCFWFIGTQSFTYDEGAHIIAGLDAWRHGRFEQWNDQPPLGRLLVTAPLLSANAETWQIEDRGPSGANFWTVSLRPDPVALAWLTRPVNVALGLVLAGVLWTTARRLFSEGGANLALALFACSPAVIAHFSLATVDGLATVLGFAAAVAVARWRTGPSWWRTLGAKAAVAAVVSLAVVWRRISGMSARSGSGTGCWPDRTRAATRSSCQSIGR